MKSFFFSVAVLFLPAVAARAYDGQLDAWLKTYSTQYARIYTSDANKLAGTSVTTWTNGSQTQSLPAYCGVQQVYYSGSWLYIRTTGLAAHVMGPWYLNSAHTSTFPNLPVNQHVLYRFPRTSTLTTAPTTKTLTALGAIGYFVDGVAMFDTRDGYVWTGSAESSSGTGYWNREAYVNESVTFDPGYAHQENTGTHHYHADPIALRYLLGDHVDYLAASGSYQESTSTVTKHSPILGWVRDGYPIYGPYGYSSALDATSGLRRMISGYQLRNGQNGSDTLTTRSTIPAWAQRVYGVSASQSGPTVSGTYPLGRYMEDYAYLGDLVKSGTTKYQQGVDYDLDEYNGRYCVTPEYPNGTYAYFVAISTSGTPVFPYNIGRAFYGNPTGSTQTSIGETVTTYFDGGPDLADTMDSATPSGNDVTIAWNSVEGGVYKLEGTNDLTTSYATLTTTATASAGTKTTVLETNGAVGTMKRFYRVTRMSLASYDAVTTGTTTTSGTATITMSPTSGARGSTFTVTATINSSATPTVPPQNAGVSSFTVGSISVTSPVHTSQYVVTGTLTIPGAAATGSQTVTITFQPPQGQPSGPSYTQANAFTITQSALTARSIRKRSR